MRILIPIADKKEFFRISSILSQNEIFFLTRDNTISAASLEEREARDKYEKLTGRKRFKLTNEQKQAVNAGKNTTTYFIQQAIKEFSQRKI